MYSRRIKVILTGSFQAGHPNPKQCRHSWMLLESEISIKSENQFPTKLTVFPVGKWFWLPGLFHKKCLGTDSRTHVSHQHGWAMFPKQPGHAQAAELSRIHRCGFTEAEAEAEQAGEILCPSRTRGHFVELSVYIYYIYIDACCSE